MEGRRREAKGDEDVMGRRMIQGLKQTPEQGGVGIGESRCRMVS